MTLFDVSKNRDDRSSPKPNGHDRLTSGAIMSKGTNSSNYTSAQDLTSGVGALLRSGDLRFVRSGTISVPHFPGEYTNQGVVNHNLGYVPLTLAFMQTCTDDSGNALFIGNNIPIPHSEIPFSGRNAGTVVVHFDITAFGDAVFFTVETPDFSSTFGADVSYFSAKFTAVILYYLFQQPSQNF